jgi:ureidoacrylate peracid hydrolase
MSSSNPDPFRVHLSSSAFLIVDMQNDFVRVGAPLEVPDTRRTIAPIREVGQAFRRAGRPVVSPAS